jgi:hypothetical protein
MDDTYLINIAKTEFREAYNRGDVEQLLSVFDEEGFTDMSEGGPSLYDQAAREGLRERATELFAHYDVKLTVIVIEIVVWKKNSSGQWRISSFINNADVREELGGRTSHWFLSEEQAGDAGGAVTR